jgi:hypothetical protein
VEVIAIFDPVMADKVQQIQKNPNNMTYHFGGKKLKYIILT